MQVRTLDDGTLLVRCGSCRHWFRNGEHNFGLCEDAMWDAADSERKSRIEDAELYSGDET